MWMHNDFSARLQLTDIEIISDVFAITNNASMNTCVKVISHLCEYIC